MKNEHYKKEFNKLFVEPIATEMRAMNLNNEPCVMGSEKKVWAWIEKALKQTQKKEFDAGYDIGFVDGTEKACRGMLVEEREEIIPIDRKPKSIARYCGVVGHNKCCAKQREQEKLIKKDL